MPKPLSLLLLVLFFSLVTCARDKQENWVRVSSQHFTVICDGSEKEARRLTDQFERMRLVFQTAFPKLNVDPSAPIMVIAVKDAKAFRALEPEAYLAKGQLELAGLFLRAPDKNYVLLRVDAGGEHPYASVYHEYTHLLLSRAEWMPLWLNEGLAEFYQNTDISEKHTMLGQASADDIIWLRQNRLLPLPTLLAVDHNSPYYHEEKKGSIFYAESWALTHYLEVRDAQNNSHKLSDYVALLSQKADPVAAASQAFGDLKQLQSALDIYIRGLSFNAFRLTKPLVLDEASFQSGPITSLQADAIRADFLAYNRREKDAHLLLDHILQEDPNNTLAHETMGYLEFNQGHIEQAQKWFEQAVKLDSQSYLANYYYAAMAINHGLSGPDTDQQIETSLLNAIKLNPSFAPSYDRLAVFYAMRGKHLDAAHRLNLQAVQLEPTKMEYRLNTARVLLSMHREVDARAVLEAALTLATRPEDISALQNELDVTRQIESERRQGEEDASRVRETTAEEDAYSEHLENTPVHEEALTGPHRIISGTVRNVRCSAPASIDMDIDSGGKTVTLHSGNFYKIKFSALGYVPKPEFQPCTDLEGLHGNLEYIESTAAKVNGVIAIELHK